MSNISIYKKIGIYGIRNTVNQKVYVGQTRMNFGDRWDQHRATLRGNYNGNPGLQDDWNFYGEQNFEFFIMEECSKNITAEELDMLEIKYISEYRKKGICYNIANGGRQTVHLGKHLSEKTRRKIGEKNRIHMTGHKASEETKKKMSESQKSRWIGATDEERAAWGKKMAQYTTGVVWSEEAKQRFSEKQKTAPNGSKYTLDTVHKIREMHEQQSMGYTEIAQELGIPRGTVYNIATYRRWPDA